MRNWRVHVSLLLAATFLATAANAAVKVNFIGAERYRDVRGSGSRAGTLNELRQHLQTLGARYLKPGQTLSIDILDVDLAGEMEPMSRTGSEIRVVRSVTPPKIKLRYKLVQRGRVIAQGRETLTDMNYMMRSGSLSQGHLSYEKDMLSTWFRSKFTAK